MRSEWARVQVWRPLEALPVWDPECILYIADADIDIDHIHEAVKIVQPMAVLPPWLKFEPATLVAHTIRDDKKYSTGVILPPVITGLEKYISWATEQKLGPIVFTGMNFYGGIVAQDKGLWQLASVDAFKDKQWYHLATDKRPEAPLPGRWTVGRDFLDSGARQQRTPGVRTIA